MFSDVGAPLRRIWRSSDIVHIAVARIGNECAFLKSRMPDSLTDVELLGCMTAPIFNIDGIETESLDIARNRVDA